MISARRVAGRVKRKLETQARYNGLRDLGGGMSSEQPIAIVTKNLDTDSVLPFSRDSNGVTFVRIKRPTNTPLAPGPSA